MSTNTCLRQTLPVWARIGALSFGGPAAQIALMHREIVETRGWLSEAEFLRIISLCMLLPGPEAMQIATYVGWRMNGIRGGLLAGGLFVLPGALVIFALALLYVTFGTMDLIRVAFVGLQAAVIAIVFNALISLAKRTLTRAHLRLIAVCGFLALFLLGIPFPIVILAAAFIGAIWCQPDQAAHGPIPHHDVIYRQTLQTLAIWATIWASPLMVLWLADPQGLLLQIGLFFSKLAVVTFGGAYALLAYMSQTMVTDLNWLSAAQMIDALALAETTPGPLILVTQFTAILTAMQSGGVWFGLLAGTLTLWVTFVPCFLWIFVAAPYVEWITRQPRLAGALQGISACVVGVILSLGLWFALHVLFGDFTSPQLGGLRDAIPDIESLNPSVALLTCGAFALISWRKWSIVAALTGIACAAVILELFARVIS